MPYVDRLHWEHGEQHPEFVNLDSSPPIVDEVTAADAYSGGYCQHWQFGASDDVLISSSSYTKTGAADAVLLGAAIKISDLTQFDYIYPLIFAHTTTSGTTHVGIRINPDGSVAIGRPSTNLSGALLASSFVASPSGVIQPGTWHYVSARLVVDNSAGECQVRVDGAEVAAVSGVDTNASGTLTTAWGFAMILETGTGNSGDIWVDDMVAAQDMAEPFKPQMHEALSPNGVTASNDGTVFGGAADAAAATDEIPGTATDGFTLDAVNDLQGLSFPSRTQAGTITGVQVWGQVGDQAAGSEELTCNVDDGTAVEAGAPVPLNSAFASQRLSALLNEPPSGSSWSDVLFDALTVEFERTA